jgi:hypothetical protein
MSRRLKVLSLLLGILMLMFGFLKFFPPINGWFDIQIQQCHLPHQAVLAGKLGEMLTGFLFLLPWLRKQLTPRSRNLVLLAASLVLVAQMIVAIYVHLQPEVPASVLPLGIKPPVIPAVVLLLGLLTAFYAEQALRSERASINSRP